MNDENFPYTRKCRQKQKKRNKKSTRETFAVYVVMLNIYVYFHPYNMICFPLKKEEIDKKPRIKEFKKKKINNNLKKKTKQYIS